MNQLMVSTYVKATMLKRKAQDFLQNEEGKILEDIGMNWLSVLLVVLVVATIIAAVTGALGTLTSGITDMMKKPGA